MKFIHSFYKTRNLANNGKYLIILTVVLFLSGSFLIPEFKVKNINKQLYNVNGISLKYNDNNTVLHFVRSIKKNKGYLCLGTSETSILPDGNYFDFLNNDPEFEYNFSVLAGAGRTCGIYIPIFLSHRTELDSLKIIYFINPVYWRADLCKVSKDYWDRYSNYAMCKNVEMTNEERQAYFLPVEAYYDKLNYFQKVSSELEYFFRKQRKSYFYDLRYLLNPEEYEDGLTFISPKKNNSKIYNNFGRIDYEKMDTIWNVLRTFSDKDWFKAIDKSDKYRFEELLSFIKLCKDLSIKATYILGPYNGRFIEKYENKSLKAYDETVQKIRKMLMEENVSFIDASDISFTTGAFNDHQHHSSYGAFLIYKKIKFHFNEKETN